VCGCYRVYMRVHILLDDDLVRELDRRVGARQRSAYVARAIERALDDDRRWELMESSIGSIADEGHHWDADPAEWVREQRHGDVRRVG
jgi:Arc/MetJ family transcription regulator